MKTFRLFIGGDWCDPAGGKWFDSIEPYTGRPWARIPHGGPEDVEAAVAAARHAFEQGDWARTNATTRGRLLRRLGDLLRDQGEEIARIEARDNGKRLAEALPQFRYLPEWLYYYGGLADKVEGAVIPLDIPDVFNFTRYEPLGVVAAITPWNSPVMLMLWKLAPALAAGNTLVVKPSEHASASTLAFMELVQQAGFPPGVVNVVTGFADGAGEPLVSHPDVAKVTFTGSVNGGRAVNRTAADQLKPVTLELGGKSPQIVFADANLDNAVNGVLSGLFLSNGQTCVAGARILVQEEIAPEFEQRLVGALADLRMGDPSDPATRIGPIANEMQFDTILGFLDSAKAEGAELVVGGHRATRPGCEEGWFVEPTVYRNVRPDMRIAREEIFGPVAGMMTFTDEAEAVAMANDSPFGLAAGVWTENIRLAHRMAASLKCGTVYINTYRSVSMMSPAGGYKLSGIGRENGQEMIREFLQVKSVWINNAEVVPNPFA